MADNKTKKMITSKSGMESLLEYTINKSYRDKIPWAKKVGFIGQELGGEILIKSDIQGHYRAALYAIDKNDIRHYSVIEITDAFFHFRDYNNFAKELNSLLMTSIDDINNSYTKKVLEEHKK